MTKEDGQGRSHSIVLSANPYNFIYSVDSGSFQKLKMLSDVLIPVALAIA